MSAKGIYEATGKRLLTSFLPQGVAAPARHAQVASDTNWDALVQKESWLLHEVCHLDTIRFNLAICYTCRMFYVRFC